MYTCIDFVFLKNSCRRALSFTSEENLILLADLMQVGGKRRNKLFDLMQNKHAVHRGGDAIPNFNGNE